MRRLTSPPSARPLVSRITGPTSAPIALALPPRMRSTTSGLSAITLATIACELAAVLHRGQALALDDLGRVAAVGDQLVEDDAAVAGGHRARRRPASTSLASAAGVDRAPARRRARAAR